MARLAIERIDKSSQSRSDFLQGRGRGQATFLIASCQCAALSGSYDEARCGRGPSLVTDCGREGIRGRAWDGRTLKEWMLAREGEEMRRRSVGREEVRTGGRDEGKD